MRATITRKMIVSTITGYMIEIREEKPTVKEVEPVTIYGKTTPEKALKELQRVYGKTSSVTVAGIKEEEKQYEISVEDFIKYAKIVEETPENEENKSEVK